jgi:3-isopropylmalate dehydrogenase
MMLDHVGSHAEASRIETAVVECLEAGECTADVGGRLGTEATGDAVVRRMVRR